MDYPSGYIKGSICGVLAVAVATRQDFDYVYCEFAIRKHRPNKWAGRTIHSERIEILECLGAKFTDMPQYVGLTVNRFAMRFANPKKLYMVNAGRHVMTLYDNMLLDQDENMPYELHPCKQFRIHNVTRIDSYQE